VIGERFAWAHLPKTGGSATAVMFRRFPDLIVFADRPDTNEHASFRERWDQVEGKLLAINFRRLPCWVLSRAHQVNRYGLAPKYEPLPMASPHELAASSFPDERLATYTDAGTVRIDRWLRMERLAEDLLAFVSELRDVTAAEREAVMSIGAVNALDYDHDVRHWFSADDVRTLYASNPAWSAVEERLYGDLAYLD
jgi:hypothetical protein